MKLCVNEDLTKVLVKCHSPLQDPQGELWRNLCGITHTLPSMTETELVSWARKQKLLRWRICMERAQTGPIGMKRGQSRRRENKPVCVVS